jgi:hypothetical protein
MFGLGGGNLLGTPWTLAPSQYCRAEVVLTRYKVVQVRQLADEIRR